MNNILQDRAMLVSLTISQWTNRRHDKKASQQVEQANNAKQAGRFHKVLVSKDALEAIAKIASQARDFHYHLTMPWGNNGERLLPSTLFMKYTDAMSDFKLKFSVEVDRFVRDYPQLVADAQLRLGSLYNAADYPDSRSIRDRFGIHTDFVPVPAAEDFRVQLNDEYVDKIRQEITSKVTQRQREAVYDCWRRVREVVEHIHERLADKDKVFRDTLISNAKDLVEILPALNFTNDENLNQIASEVNAILVAPERLRTDETLRSDVASKAADILARLPTCLA